MSEAVISGNIKQLQASYKPLEDRILFTIRTEDQQFQAWLTRRFMKLLVPALQGQHPTSGEPLFSDALLEQQAQKSADPDFDPPPVITPDDLKPAEPKAELEQPLGEVPLLLVKFSFKPTEEDFPSLIMEPEQGPGLSFSFHPQMVGALVKILSQALAVCDWELNLPPILGIPEAVTLH